MYHINLNSNHELIFNSLIQPWPLPRSEMTAADIFRSRLRTLVKPNLKSIEFISIFRSIECLEGEWWRILFDDLYMEFKTVDRRGQTTNKEWFFSLSQDNYPSVTVPKSSSVCLFVIYLWVAHSIGFRSVDLPYRHRLISHLSSYEMTVSHVGTYMQRLHRRLAIRGLHSLSNNWFNYISNSMSFRWFQRIVPSPPLFTESYIFNHLCRCWSSARPLDNVRGTDR